MATMPVDDAFWRLVHALCHSSQAWEDGLHEWLSQPTECACPVALFASVDLETALTNFTFKGYLQRQVEECLRHAAQGAHASNVNNATGPAVAGDELLSPTSTRRPFKSLPTDPLQLPATPPRGGHLPCSPEASPATPRQPGRAASIERGPFQSLKSRGLFSCSIPSPGSILRRPCGVTPQASLALDVPTLTAAQLTIAPELRCLASIHGELLSRGAFDKQVLHVAQLVQLLHASENAADRAAAGEPVLTAAVAPSQPLSAAPAAHIAEYTALVCAYSTPVWVTLPQSLLTVLAKSLVLQDIAPALCARCAQQARRALPGEDSIDSTTKAGPSMGQAKANACPVRPSLYVYVYIYV